MNTSIGLETLNSMRMGLATKQEILDAIETDTADLADLRDKGRPRASVSVSRIDLQGESTSGSQGSASRSEEEEWLRRAELRMRGLDPDLPDLIPYAQAEIYDLSVLNRVDVVRVGRYTQSDLNLKNKYISREHGLVMYWEDEVLFCDYGTEGVKQDGDEVESSMDEGHYGSTNGTYINGNVLIRNELIVWRPCDALMLGWQKTGDGLEFDSILTYELISSKVVQPCAT